VSVGISHALQLHLAVRTAVPHSFCHCSFVFLFDHLALGQLWRAIWTKQKKYHLGALLHIHCFTFTPLSGGRIFWDACLWIRQQQSTLRHGSPLNKLSHSGEGSTANGLGRPFAPWGADTFGVAEGPVLPPRTGVPSLLGYGLHIVDRTCEAAFTLLCVEGPLLTLVSSLMNAIPIQPAHRQQTPRSPDCTPHPPTYILSPTSSWPLFP